MLLLKRSAGREGVLPRGLCEAGGTHWCQHLLGTLSADTGKATWDATGTGATLAQSCPQSDTIPKAVSLPSVFITPLGCRGWSTKHSTNTFGAQSLGPSGKKGRAELKSCHKSWAIGEGQVPEGSTGRPNAHKHLVQRQMHPWKRCTHSGAACQKNNSPPSADGTSSAQHQPAHPAPPVVLQRQRKASPNT